MTLSEFEAEYGARFRAFTYTVWQKACVPAHLLPDMRQAAWLGVARGLRSWQPGAGYSAFNWCRWPMTSEMQCEVAMFLGAKRGRMGRRKVYPTLVRDVALGGPSLPDSIDVRRLLDGLTDRERRLVLGRIHDVSGETLAALEGTSRQRVQQIQMAAIKRLRRAVARNP